MMKEATPTYSDFSSLSLSELLSMILRERRTAKQVGNSLLTSFGSLRDLTDATVEEISAVPGIGPAKARRIKATLELVRRLATLPPEARVTIGSPRDVADLLMGEMRLLTKEHFRVLLLNTKNQVLAVELVSVGTLNASLVHPRELFRTAIKRSCAGVVLAHNHPSGNPSPSQEDVDLTRRLVQAGKVLGIEVLDHLVLGDGSWVSLRERGMM